MKKEITSLGKVSFSNKVIIANPSCRFEKQNNMYIVIIKKFENMSQEKYNKFTFIEKKIFQYYREMKENNYSEITITDFIY